MWEPTLEETIQARFEKVRSRVFRLLVGKRLLSRHALQHQISEVGPAEDREDPRWLDAALLSKGHSPLRPSEQPHTWSPVSGFYLSPSIQPEEMPELIATAVQDLKVLAALFKGDEASTLAHTIVNHLTPKTSSPKYVGHHEITPGGDITITSQEVVVDLSEMASAPVLGLITNDPDWLFPDNPMVWKHFARCLDRRAYPVFIARKLSIPMFPLLKQVAGVGIQLHHIYVHDEVLETASELAAEMHWIRPAAITNVRSHKAFDILKEQLHGRTPSFAQQLAYKGIEAGLKMGFANNHAKADAMLKWASLEDVTMPTKWVEEVRLWSRWDSEGSLRQ